jgi:hypothetical protein
MSRPCPVGGAADAGGIGKPAKAIGAERIRGAEPPGCRAVSHPIGPCA